MALTVPQYGMDGYSLIEWFNELNTFLNTRKVIGYQVTPNGENYHPNTTVTNYTLLQSDHHLLVVNPGDITLPIASVNRGKQYGIIAVPNPSANWAVDNALLVPSSGDTVGFLSSLKIIHKQGSGSVLFRFPFFVTSDGIANWVVHR
jgi:hypothetical protein